MLTFWIIFGSVAGGATTLLTVWLVVIARRPSAPVATAERGPEVTVEVSNIFEAYDDGRTGPWAFGIQGINRSDHPIRFTSAGFERADGEQIVITQHPYGTNLIRTIPPHDSGQTWMYCDDLAASGLDIFEPIVGWVRTATGDLYKSEPKTLREP